MRFKRILSACMSAVMMLTSVNFAWAGESDVFEDITPTAEENGEDIRGKYAGMETYGSHEDTDTVYPVEGGNIYIRDNAVVDADKSITSAVIPNGVTVISFEAFRECRGLKSISIPDSVTSISAGAFEYCSSLTSISIPDSVTSISSDAFKGCISLTNISIPDSVTSIGQYAFDGCSRLTSISIPNGVTSIGSGAFDGCSRLTSISIPNSVTTIGIHPFRLCKSLKEINVDISNKSFCSVNGILYTKDMKSLVCCPIAYPSTNISLPSGVTSIDSEAFYGCSSLTSISLPSGMTSIGSYAFDDCSSLTSISLPNSVTSIGSEAFSNCSSLTNISIPNSVTSIGDDAFYNCSSLTSISIPNSVTSIRYGTFEYCSSLTSISIPNSVTYIGRGAFLGCSRLTNISIPDNVTSIGGSTFCRCGSLTSISIPNGVTSIDGAAFEDCGSLTSINIPNSVTSIESSAFVGCSTNKLTFYVESGSYAETWAQKQGFKTSNDIPSGGGQTEPTDDEENAMTARFNGIAEIEYDKDKKTYNTDSFDFYVVPERAKLKLYFGDNKAPSGKVKVKLTAPSGFSFSASGDESTKEFDSEVNVSTKMTVYLKSPDVGEHTFTAEITNSANETYKAEYKINVVQTGFQEDIYRADYNINRGAAINPVENYVLNGSPERPAKILKDEAEKNHMAGASFAWSAMNKAINLADSPGKLLDYSFEEKSYYKAMIFDLVDAKLENSFDEAINNKALKEIKSFKSTVIGDLKDLYTYNELQNGFFTVSAQKNGEVMKLIKNRFITDHKALDNIDAVSGFVFDGIEYAGNMFDITEMIYNNYQLYMLDDSTKQMLSDMYDAAPSDNTALKMALLETKTLIESSEAEVAAEVAAGSLQMAGNDAVQHIVNEVWSDAKNKAYEAVPELLVAHMIIKSNQYVLEKGFNTSKTVEAYYKLGVVEDIGTAVKGAYNKSKSRFTANKNINNAQKYNNAVKFLGAYYNLNCNTAKAFPDAVNDAIYTGAFDVEGTTELKYTIDDWNNYVKGRINRVNCGEWIYQLQTDYPEYYSYYDSIRDNYKVYDIHCPVDVYVFDKNGVLVASVEGKSLYYDGEAKITIARNGDKKTVYTYGDEYTVIYKATDNGTMDIIVNEYSNGENTATVNFNDVELVKDAEYKSEENGKYGTEAEYSLEKNNAKVSPDYDSSKSLQKYKLNIQNGIIADTSEKTGEYSAGEKISIVTYIPQGEKFAGWRSNVSSNVFEDAKAVSTTITMPAADIEITSYVNEAGGNIDVPEYPIDKEIVLEPYKTYVRASVDGKNTISASKIGSTVDVDFDIIQNEGFASYTYDLYYDPTVLRAKVLKQPENYTGYVCINGTPVYETDPNKWTINDAINNIPQGENKTAAQLGKIRTAWVSKYFDKNMIISEAKGDGRLFTITFEVIGKGDADIRVEGVMSVTPIESDERSITYEPYPDSIYVINEKSSFTYGDAGGSGKVDASDASMVLQKALSNSYTMPIQGKTSDWLKYVDVNINGSVDADDAANIMQKTLNGSFTMPAEKAK